MTRRGWCPPLFAQHDAPSTPSPAAERVVLSGGGYDDDGGVGGAGTDGGGAGTLEDVEAIQRVLSSLGDSMPLLSDGQVLS